MYIMYTCLYKLIGTYKTAVEHYVYLNGSPGFQR